MLGVESQHASEALERRFMLAREMQHVAERSNGLRGVRVQLDRAPQGVLGLVQPASGGSICFAGRMEISAAVRLVADFGKRF
jgi:hypothetical protein